MSFEAILTTEINLDLLTQNKVIACFEGTEALRVIDREYSGEKSSHVYAYMETSRESRPEDFYVSFEKNQVYLCFYSATSQQQSQITNALTACLHEAGIKGAFEEV